MVELKALTDLHEQKIEIDRKDLVNHLPLVK